MKAIEIMWLVVMFDLPMTSESQKRAYTRFRDGLLRLGFTRLQWSVYARSYPREQSGYPDRDRIVDSVPKGGRVRLLYVTDLQFERMLCIDGVQKMAPEKRLEQVLVFDN